MAPGHGLYHDLMHVTHLPFLPEQCPLSPELRRDVVGRLPGGELRLRPRGACMALKRGVSRRFIG